MKTLRTMFVLAALLFALSGLALAQTATITGTVTDSSGALVPGATVTITNIDTNALRTVTADGRGNYVAPLLPVGMYRVEVDQPGFQKEVMSDITISTNETVRVDVRLTPGAVTQTVEVTGAAPIVQSENATVGDVINEQKVEEMPLNGRHFETLSLLVPGVTSTSPAPSGGAAISISSGGARFSSNNFRLDGTNDVAEGGGTGISVRPIVDAIQEFKIQTNDYSAEFGRGGGANIEVVTKSGTNLFHGSAWDFLRNDDLDAKDYFDIQKQAYRRNQFGATLGGPIKKDKTFFFFAYEGIRRLDAQAGLLTVPTAAERSGNFSALPGVIKNPLSGVPFAGNMIPSSLFVASSLAIQQYYPLPNSTTTGASNYLSRNPQTDNEDQFNARIDHRFSDSNLLFGRLTTNKTNDYNPCAGMGTACLPSFPTSAIGRNTQFTISDTYIFTPQLLNVFNTGVNRGANVNNNFAAINGVNVAASLGIPGIPSSTRAIDYGMPTIAITGFQGMSSQDYNPSFETIYTANDTLSYVKGSHSIRAGFEIGQELFYAAIGRARDSLTYGGAAPATGNAYADFLLGYLSQSQEIPTDFTRYRYSYTYGTFLQDDWKILNNLTLNLGVRYDYQTPDTEKQNRASEINPYTGQLEIAGVNGASRSLYSGDGKDWAPRIGVAYRPMQGMVVRAGYGIFYDVSLQGAQLGQTRVSPPFFTNETFTSIAGNPGALTSLNPFPTALQPNAILNYTSVQPDFKNGNVQQWNFGIQKEVRRNMVLEVGYTGSKGTHLYDNVDLNQAVLGTAALQSRRPYPLLGTDITLESNSNSSYNALITRFERRFSSGMSFLAAYTWSHSLDDFSSANPNGQSAQASYNLAAEHANSDFDTRQRLVLSYVYELPFGKGRRLLSGLPVAANAVLGGWQLSGLSQFQSGNPVNVIISGTRSNTGTTNLDRPNATGISPYYPSGGAATYFLNPAAYALEPLNTFGNVGRNSAVGPRFIDTDVALVKQFTAREKWVTEFRMELFNAFNHPLLGQPTAAFNTPTFGQITTTRGDQRNIQFALKVFR